MKDRKARIIIGSVLIFALLCITIQGILFLKMNADYMEERVETFKEHLEMERISTENHNARLETSYNAPKQKPRGAEK